VLHWGCWAGEESGTKCLRIFVAFERCDDKKHEPPRSVYMAAYVDAEEAFIYPF
jgi:hypothetical protein